MSACARQGCTEIDDEWREDDGELSGDDGGVMCSSWTSVCAVECVCACELLCVRERVRECTVEHVIDATHET